MHHKKIAALVSAAAAFIVPSVQAFERDHAAHEHGHASLNIVLENTELQILLETPAMNLVGFEYQPKTEEQRAKVAKIERALASLDTLATLPQSASCSLEHFALNSPFQHDMDEHDAHEETHEKHHDEDEHHHDDHNDDHNDDHHAHHHDDHHDDDAQSHSDYSVEWHIECENISDLNRLEINLFRHFPNMEELESQVISDKGQSLQELSAKETILRLP